MLKAESWVVERCVVVQQLLLLHPSTLARYLQQLMAEELPTARYILTGHPTIAKERSLFQASNTQMKPKMSKDVFQFCVGVVVSSVAAAVDDHLAGLKKTKINRARARRLSSMKMIKPLYKDSHQHIHLRPLGRLGVGLLCGCFDLELHAAECCWILHHSFGSFGRAAVFFFFWTTCVCLF